MRVGFACGNAHIIQALARIKNYDIPTLIQIGAIEALRGPQACVAEHAATYEARRDTLIDGVARPGPGHWLIEKPKATMFVWARIPAPHRDMGSLEFAKLLLRGTKDAVSPGIGFGKTGEGHLRFALVENQHRIRQARCGTSDECWSVPATPPAIDGPMIADEPLSECLAASHVNLAARQRARRDRSHSTSMGSPSLATLAFCILRSTESSLGKANS